MMTFLTSVVRIVLPLPEEVAGLCRLNGRITTAEITSQGWFRIARLSDGVSGLVNISKRWSNQPPVGILLYFDGSLYGLHVKQLAGTLNPSFITKARINSTSSGKYLEIYYNLDKENTVYFSWSNIVLSLDILMFEPSTEDGEVSEINISNIR